MATPVPLLFALTGTQTSLTKPLAALLAELLAGRPATQFQIAEDTAAQQAADILVVAGGEVNAANATQTRIWIGADKPLKPELFAGIFQPPVNLPHVLDTALTAWRLKKIKTARALTPQISFDPFARVLRHVDGSVQQNLSEREASFLLAVLDAGEDGLQRDKAVTEVWGFHRDVESHAVETTAYRLRQKLSSAFGEAITLNCEKGGYRLQVGG